MIYHYTTFTTLDAILNSQSIKFNKLTNMDDMEEFELFRGHFDPREYVFVSSWTKEEKENITLWNCYGDKANGVRIGLPEMPFPLYHPVHPKIKTYHSLTPEDEGYPWFLLPFEEAFTPEYCVISFY